MKINKNNKDYSITLLNHNPRNNVINDLLSAMTYNLDVSCKWINNNKFEIFEILLSTFFSIIMVKKFQSCRSTAIPNHSIAPCARGQKFTNPRSNKQLYDIQYNWEKDIYSPCDFCFASPLVVGIFFSP
jgi:hypothetical protein